MKITKETERLIHILLPIALHFLEIVVIKFIQLFAGLVISVLINSNH